MFVTVLFEFDITPRFCLAGKYLNLNKFANFVTRKKFDKSDFLGLLLLFVVQLKRVSVSFLHYKLFNRA